MEFKTADLCDDHIDELQILNPLYKSYGLKKSFFGQAVTVKVFEDNVLVKNMLGTDGTGKVLVVDGGGSTRCALLGDNLANMAIENNWAGVIIHGCIRDSGEINKMDVGIRAVNTCPAKSIKRGEGQTNINIEISGAKITKDDYIYSDEDGIVVSKKKLH